MRATKAGNLLISLVAGVMTYVFLFLIPLIGALLNNPSGVAVGPDGRLLLAHIFNHRIRRVS